MHRPFTPTNSLPLKPSTSFPNFTSNEKIEDPFEQRNKLQLGFQTANPFSTDPFGFSYQGSVTTRTTSLDSPITLLPVNFSFPPSATSHVLHLHNQVRRRFLEACVLIFTFYYRCHGLYDNFSDARMIFDI